MASLAQQTGHFYAYGGLGGMYYVGDLKDNAFPKQEFVHLAANLGVKYKYKNLFSVGLGYVRGKITGADSLGNKNSNRDFFFRSRVNDFHLLFKINLFNHNKLVTEPDRLLVTPGILAGFGYFTFNPQVQIDDVWIDAQPLGTEGQNLGGTYPSPYQLNGTNLKLGAELTFYISRRVNLDLYAIYNRTNTDYLDDVGGVYPDYNELLAGPNGVVAAQFAFRNNNGEIRDEGTPRGNPDSNDGFYTMGVNFSVKITGEPRKRNGGRKRVKLKKRARF